MKVTNIKKLWIKFIGGGLIKFPHENLREVKIEGDGLDGGGGGQEEVDIVKQHIDNVVLNLKESNHESDYVDLVKYKTDLNISPVPFSEIPKEYIIGDINNFDYVLIDESTIDENDEESGATFVLLTNEQLQYYNNKFVNNSFKDFIISTLNISDLSIVFEEYNFDSDDFSEVIAMNKEDFKFFVGLIDETTQSATGVILDDFDVKYLGAINSMGYTFYTIFNNNETRKIFYSYINYGSAANLGSLRLGAEKSQNRKVDVVINDKNYIIYDENEIG